MLRLVLAFAVLLCAVPVRAAPATPDSSASPYAIPYEKYALQNGLEVILHRDPSLPLVSINVWYHVGPSNEPPGRSGFAHLFEHLMFEGSKHAGRQFDILMETIGATGVNGTTSWDRTNYFETFPREHLELVLWLESDRMGFMLDALDAERLEVQRDVVKNERRQRYENSPYGPSDLAMYDLLFPPNHPYHGAVIGSMEDLSRAGLADVREFFTRYYAPSNATIAIAGDIDLVTTKRLVERYFGTLSTMPGPPRAAKPTGPLTTPKRVVIREPVQLGRVAVAWSTPPAFTDDDAALELASAILGGGKAARLYQELVVKRRLSPDVSVWLDSNAVSSTLSIEAIVARGKKSDAVEAAIAEVVQKLATDGPTEAELARAKRGIEVSVLSSLQLLTSGSGDGGRTGFLQRLNHYLGDPGRLAAEMERLARQTRDDVKRAVQAHLGTRSATVITEPAPGAHGETS